LVTNVTRGYRRGGFLQSTTKKNGEKKGGGPIGMDGGIRPEVSPFDLQKPGLKSRLRRGVVFYPLGVPFRTYTDGGGKVSGFHLCLVGSQLSPRRKIPKISENAKSSRMRRENRTKQSKRLAMFQEEKRGEKTDKKKTDRNKRQ